MLEIFWRRLWLHRKTMWMAVLACLCLKLAFDYYISCVTEPSSSESADTQWALQYYPLVASEEPPYDLKRLPWDDYTRLMNLTDFRFTKLSLCNDTQPLLLLLIHSAPENKIERASIRATWGAARESMCLRFLIGATKPWLERRLQQEQRRHGDLVQGNFLDTYRNLTYKHVMVFKYATYHCPRARYILKTDDDVFVNMHAMMTFLKDMSVWGARRLIFCDVFKHMKVIRTNGNKWRVLYTEFRPEYFPPYCSGWVILYSPDAAFELYEEAQHSKYFWIDDVFITGLLSKRVQLTHKRMPDDLILRDRDKPKLWWTNSTDALFKFLIMDQYGMTPTKIRAIWNTVDSYYKRRKVTEDYYYFLK